MIFSFLCALFLSILGIFLTNYWYKRVKAWDSPKKANDEYMECLLYGWTGVMACIIGIPTTIICFIALF